MADPGNSYKSNPHVRQTVDKTAVVKNDLSKSISALKKENVKPIDYRYVDTFKGVGKATKKDSIQYKEGYNEARLNAISGKKDNSVGTMSFSTSRGDGAQEYKDKSKKK